MSKLIHPSQQTKFKIKIIFIYYASFGDRNNFKFLKMQNFRRFLIDSDAVKDDTEFPVFDIAFRKVNHSAVQFQQFLEMVPSLACLLYQKESRSYAFQSYLQNKIQPLYAQIMTQSDFGCDIKAILNLKVDEKALSLLENCSPLKRVFDQYILSTSMHQKDPESTFERVHEFLKDFEISPQLASKSLCFIIFEHILNEKEDTNKFQMEDLKKILIFISEIYYKKQFDNTLCSPVKLLKVLERMEVSSGFRKMVARTQNQNSQVISFLKNIDMLEHLETDHCMKSLSNSIEKIWPASTRHKNCSMMFSSKKVERVNNYETVKTLLDESNSHMSQDLREIKKVFCQLCSHGEVANTKTLKSMKIKKLFQKINILTKVNQAWMDINITDLCRRSLSGKIQFSQFIELLGLTAQRLQTSQEHLIEFIINSHTLERQKLQLNSQTVQHQYSINQKVLEMISHIEKSLERVFHYYSKSKREISFSELTKLMFDFEIFPSVIAKVKLYAIFLKCADQFSGSSQLSKLVSEKKIDLKGFQNLLIETSWEICDKELNQEQKIIILLEKMHESNGHKKVLLGKGLNLVAELRNKFGSIYQMNFQSKKDINIVSTFNELLKEYEHP